MATPTLVQNAIASGSATSFDITFASNCTSGNLIAATTAKPNTNSGKSFTISDATNGNYTLAKKSPEVSGYFSQIDFFQNSTFTGTAITTTVNSGTTSRRVAVYEIQDAETTGQPHATGSHDGGGVTTPHYYAGATEFSTTQPTFIVAVTTTSGNMVSSTPHADYTEYDDQTQMYFQYGSFSANRTNDRAESTPNTSQRNFSCIAAFDGAAVGGNPKGPLGHPLHGALGGPIGA